MPGVKIMDISNHQSTMDVERVVRENGIGAVFILTNDGTFVNAFFHAQADAAERAGAIVVPYFYLRPNWAQTVDVHIGVVGDRYDSSIVDVEEGSGGWAETWAAHNRLWDAGRYTPLVYFPNFYWQKVGSPDLTPLKVKVRGHWKSWYADRDWREFQDALDRVPGYVWDDNRGGILVEIVQFTGTGRVSGYGAHVDLNFYRGSIEELAALLGKEEDDMKLTDRITNAWDGTPTLEEVFRYIDLRSAEAAEHSANAATDAAEALAIVKDIKEAVGKLVTAPGGGVSPAPGGLTKAELIEVLNTVGIKPPTSWAKLTVNPSVQL
ncbi:GH25 family lysozyme [Umezawaea sp. NPDC059074]|uniref:GH25 family lysozyme n=1 Tax=Umezawaea sp. NPDC059074 TaxID=3346716 RepID=UPI0036B2FA27